MNFNSELSEATECKNIVGDIHDIIGQINRYLHMKGTSSVVDIFFYIERSIRAKALCQQISNSRDNMSLHYEELNSLYQTVKSRWQHDFQLIATPAELHQYLRDDGRVSLNQSKIVL